MILVSAPTLSRMKLWILALLCVCTTAWAESNSTFQYTGFRQGQLGVGAILGLPAGVRVQRFLSWRSSVFVTGGYSLDKYATADANYSYYLLAQEDPWHDSKSIGYILYNVFGGLTAGFPTGTTTGTSRLGVRLGAAFEYLLPNSQWSLRAEVAPVVYLSGQTAADFQSGVAAMYYFGPGKRATPTDKK
jgi:hypothetical protein